MLGQTFAPHDLLAIVVLAGLEGLLSIDNAVVLGLLSLRVPEGLRGKALSYGLVGSVVLRLAAVGAAAWLLRFGIIKLFGGGYLLYVAGRHLFGRQHRPVHDPHRRPPAESDPPPAAPFWRTVASIELTDAAFAVDSVLAGIALVGRPARFEPADAVHPKLWVVVVGGMLGVALMRFAAAGFSKLIGRFPRMELAAHLMVGAVGLKLLADYLFAIDFEHPTSAAFWVFWAVMATAASVGFVGPRPAVVPLPQGS